jgi:serine/threonine protein kinase
VYEALHEPAGLPVALKVFDRGAFTHPEWEQRVARGAEIAAALNHPQIVPTLRAGRWDDTSFLATEFAPLGSLARLIGARPMRVETAVRIVEQLAEVTAYCHRQGVVHGNLKPENVLLAANEIPRIVDFAPAGGAPGSESIDGLRPTDVRYLPPEFVRDPIGDARVNMDIYGLGLILYELLTGRVAFEAGTAGETRELVLSCEPAPPSSINPHVGERLDVICAHCLNKDPWQRYKRAYELAKQLRLVLERGKTG